MLRYRRFTALFIALFAIASMMLAPKPAQAAGTVTVCDETSLNTALTGGGTVTFNIATPCTINFTVLKTISISTTIQNIGNTVIFDGGNARRLFTVGAGQTFNISNVTLQNGSSGFAGAVYVNLGSTLIANNVIFQNNAATGTYGGAIRVASGGSATVTISNSSFISNSAISAGGAFYTGSTGTYSFTNTTFTNNTAPSGQAIFNNSASSITFTGSTFTNNTCVPNPGVLTDGGGNSRDIASAGCPGVAPTVPLVASAACLNEDLQITVTSGDGNYNFGGTGVMLPTSATGSLTLNAFLPGPNSWTGVTVTETTGDLETINLGDFTCNANLVANIVCLLPSGQPQVTITSGDGATYTVSGTGFVLPPTLSFGLTTLVTPNDGPNTWDITLTETAGDLQSLALGSITCNRPLSVHSLACDGANMDVTLQSGDGPFNITSDQGPIASGLTPNNYTFGGPIAYTNIQVFETEGDLESVNIGNLTCAVGQTRTVEFASASGSANEALGIGNVVRVTTSDTLPTETAITLTVGVTGGTVDASDYGLTGTITIPAGTAHNSLVSIASGVAVTDDNTYEADDTLDLTISAPTNASLGAQTTYTHTIINDETARVHANPQNASINETIGTHNSRFQLTIIGTAGVLPLSTDLQVDFTVMPVELGSALEPEDFTTSTVAVYSFVAGSAGGALMNVPVTIVDDAITEPAEFFDIQLASVVNAILPPNGDTTYRNRQTVQIFANDPAGYTVNTTLTTNISEPAGTTTFTIRLNSEPVGQVDLDFVTTDSTECLVSPSSFGFNNTNWNVAQTFTITAQDDFLVDGGQPCAVMISRNITTTAPEYIAIGNPANVNITVNDNDAPATITILGGNGQSTPVNTAFGVPLLVEVRNAGNQLVQGASVAFTPPGAGASASITISPATTDVNGQASVTATANTVAGTYNVAVTSGPALPVDFSLTNTVGAPANIAFVQQPTDTVAGVIIAPNVTVSLTDSFGNGVVGQNVTLNLSTGTGVLSGTLTQVTDASGVATFNDLFINLAGVKNLTATSGALSVVSNAFTITPAAPANMAFIQQPTDEIAGFPILPAVTVGLSDAFGNAISGQTITMSINTGSGVLAGTLTQATNASGIATFNNLSINLAGVKTLRATFGALTANSTSFTITAGTPANMNFVQQPTDTVAGATIAPSVTVRVADAIGNGVLGESVTLVVSAGILSGTVTQVTDASGTATFNDLSINLIGFKNLNATSGAFNIFSNVFNITAGAPVSIAFGQQPTNAQAGATIAPAVTVTLNDNFGNPVSGQNVTLNLSTGTGVLAGTLTQATNVSGVATFNDLSINLAGSKNITATAGALSVASNAFAITVGAPANIAFVQQPTDAVAGAGITPMVSVAVTDAFGNGIAGENVILTLSTGTGALFGTLLNSTDSAGVALFPGISINLIGSKNLTATAGALSVVSNAFNITAGAPANINFVQQPTNAQAGATIAPAVTVVITDALGNGVAGQNVTMTLTTGTGVLAGTVTQATGVSGVAIFNDLSINLTGGKNITATAGALTAVSNAFTITSAAPANIAFIQQPTDAIAGATIAPPITVSVTDGIGNGVAGQTVTMTISTGTGVLGGTFTQSTDASGVATFNDLNINLSGVKNLTATSGALTAVSNAFTISADAPAFMGFMQQPTNAIAGATIAPAVTVLVVDMFSNGVPGQNVTLTLFTGTGVLAGTLTQATNASGVATFNDLSIDLIGDKNLRATVGALTANSLLFTITSAAPANIAFIQQPTDAIAGATIAPAVTVLVTDSFGNGVAGENVTLTLSTGTGVLAGTLTQVTDAIGVATFNNLSINLAGSKNLTATNGALTAISNAFTITSGAPANIAFVGQPTDAVAGATIAPAVTVSVTDGLGNGVAGQSVTLTLSTGTGALSGTLTQVTDGTGVATFNDLSINLAGGKNLTATSGALTAISNAFTITSSAPANIAFGQQPTDAVAGATIAPAVTVFVTDGLGNGVAGQSVTLTLSTGTGALSGTVTQVTDGSGIATFADLSINLAGGKNLTATSGALTVISNAFTITSGTSSNITFGQQPTNAVAGVTIAPAVTVSITDGLGNGVAGQNITLSLGTGTGTLSGTLTQVTDGAGVATFPDLSIDLVGAKTLLATSGALNVGSNIFTINAGVGTNLVLVSGTPQQAPTDGIFAAPLVARVNDMFGNPVAGETVIFTAQVGGGGQSASLSAPLTTNIFGETGVTATANSIVGAYTVEASFGAQIVTFALENLDPNMLAVSVACVDADLVVTIISGSGNFDITATYGPGMPLANVPLGAYTFFGPETWLNITVTELGGDLEILPVGTVSCDATTGGGTGTTSVPAPQDPNAVGCVLTSEVVAPGAPDNTYCRVLMRDGGVVSYSGAVPQNLVDLGVIFAVDVYRLEGGRAITTFPDYTQICLSGAGRMFYLDARLSPRDITEMSTETVDNMTCAWIPATGTLVLTN
jgi:hypothetical protein